MKFRKLFILMFCVGANGTTGIMFFTVMVYWPYYICESAAFKMLNSAECSNKLCLANYYWSRFITFGPLWVIHCVFISSRWHRNVDLLVVVISDMIKSYGPVFGE